MGPVEFNHNPVGPAPADEETAMLRFLSRAAGSVLALAWMAGGANAAPQIMALIATNDAVPLTCARGECAAEFTSICLQPHRASPAPGRLYTAVGGTGLTLLAETRDGRKLSLPAKDYVQVRAHRGHNAIRLSVSGREMSRLGVKRLSIRVGEMVTLVPTPVVGDKRPQTLGDIQLATGPMRALADRLVDSGSVQLDAAFITRDAINALPRGGRASAEQRAAAWRQAVEAKTAALSPGGLVRAKRAYQECQYLIATGTLTLRGCLGAKHDSLIGMLNNEYWNALEAGS